MGNYLLFLKRVLNLLLSLPLAGEGYLKKIRNESPSINVISVFNNTKRDSLSGLIVIFFNYWKFIQYFFVWNQEIKLLLIIIRVKSFHFAYQIQGDSSFFQWIKYLLVYFYFFCEFSPPFSWILSLLFSFFKFERYRDRLSQT